MPSFEAPATGLTGLNAGAGEARGSGEARCILLTPPELQTGESFYIIYLLPMLTQPPNRPPPELLTLWGSEPYQLSHFDWLGLCMVD